MEIKWVGAHPHNFQSGRGGRPIKRFIIHATQGSLQSAAHRFNNPKEQVSAHYGIAKNGGIEQYVSDSDTAYHAGNFEINQESIGIEFEDVKDGIEPTIQQYQAAAELLKAKAELYSIELGADTIEPHKKYRATECPGDVNLGRLINLVTDRQVRLFNPKDNTQIGVGTLVGNKVYVKYIVFKE